MSHKHKHAIILIKNEMARLGGELFLEELETLALEVRAKDGDKEVRDNLHMRDFIKKLLNTTEAASEKEKRFIALRDSLILLGKDDNEEESDVEK